VPRDLPLQFIKKSYYFNPLIKNKNNTFFGNLKYDFDFDKTFVTKVSIV
jgi:hypothetical protein